MPLHMHVLSRVENKEQLPCLISPAIVTVNVQILVETRHIQGRTSFATANHGALARSAGGLRRDAVGIADSGAGGHF